VDIERNDIDSVPSEHETFQFTGTRGDVYYKRAVLTPLLKIKAPKVCHSSPGHDAKLRELLAEAARDRDERAEQRCVSDTAKKNTIEKVSLPIRNKPPVKMQRLSIRRNGRRMPIYSPTIDEDEIVRDLTEVPGTEHVEEDLEWDFVTGEESVYTSSAGTETESFVCLSCSGSDNDDEDRLIEDAEDWEVVDEPLEMGRVTRSSM